MKIDQKLCKFIRKKVKNSQTNTEFQKKKKFKKFGGGAKCPPFPLYGKKG